MSRPGWVLAGASAGLLMLMLDATATALALPSIRLDLGASSSGIQWAQNVYLLVVAALVVTLGRLGDLIGRRAVFVVGLAVFAAGSIVCATADSIEVLVAGRAIQGLGAAAVLALSLAIATTESGRGRAIWIAASSIPFAIGPLVGGMVVEAASWRWLFLLNLPLAAIALIAVATAMPESRREEHRIGLAGLVTLSAGLTLVVLALVEGEGWGWTSVATIGSLTAGVALLAAFARIEGGIPTDGVGAAAFALVGSYWTVMFLVPQYVDLALSFSTARAGLLMLPVTLPVAVLAPLAARLTARLEARLAMTAGMACATLGALTLTRLDGSSNYYDVAPGLILFGVALGLVYAALIGARVAARGLAMICCVAGALVLATAGAVFQHVQVDERASGASFEGAFAGGIADASWLLAALLLAATIATVRSARPASSSAHPAVVRTPRPRRRA